MYGLEVAEIWVLGIEISTCGAIVYCYRSCIGKINMWLQKVFGAEPLDLRMTLDSV